MTLNFYPGMITNEIEMFVVENELRVMQSGKIISFSELPYPIFQLLKEEIELNKELQSELLKMHPVSEYRRIEQFAKCRFGGLDYTEDICNDSGNLQDGEYWPCPNRGKCSSEGILCKLPIINGTRLSDVDIKMMQLISSDKTNDVITEELNIPLGSYHKLKYQLYQKLGNIQTKQSITKIAFFLNLI